MEVTDAQNPWGRLTSQSQHMISWVKYYKSEDDDLPNTTEEWESDCNEDVFNDFEDDSITMRNEVKEEDAAFRNKKDKNTTRMQICMSGYPYFDGTASVRIPRTV